MRIVSNSDLLSDDDGEGRNPITRPCVRRGTWRVRRRGRARTESRHVRREREEVLLLRCWEPKVASVPCSCFEFWAQ
ncbi:hypothetical protein ES332_D12G094000v1 [Gossypium tomentosum]|uniref:Uncharacterized protein n=1 Tax=Gossypium tomentosum TaxID=34277 RepID=A0A5D2I750_GOSTO|nr:hypothetical protein ES332_D12G094000v1 [Gossypium tomentosum]